MNRYLQSLRPVGNPISLRKSPIDYTCFDDAYVAFYQSGTAALAAALITAKQANTGDRTDCEVLLPAYTCPDLISACLYAGVKPILVELEPESCWMSIEQIEALISERTIAIIAVRFLGIAERMNKLRDICDQHNLVLIEDSAQGFPGSNNNAYWQGDMSIISFGRGKPVNMLGGGAVITKNDRFKPHLPRHGASHAGTIKSARYLAKVFVYNLLINPYIYGMATRLPGLNIGETTYKALDNISGIAIEIKNRVNTNIEIYKQLSNISFEIHSRLKSLELSGIKDLPESCQHDFTNPLLRYPLLINDTEKRNILYKELAKLGASLMYKKTLRQIREMPEHIFDRQRNTPIAETFSQQLITLPTHSGINSSALDKIFSVLQQYQ